MSFWDLLRTEVSTQATEIQLLFAMGCLVTTLLLLVIQFLIFVKKVKKGYTLRQNPFNYYFAIYIGIYLIVLNEVILLYVIIISNQQYTILGREKALIQIVGYGLYMAGWTNIGLFHVSLKSNIKRLLRILFIGVMIFYIFAVVTTTMITFQLTFGLISTSFLGIGYEAAVGIYVSLLLADLFVLFLVVLQKRKVSKYQTLLGLLLFFALFLQILSIVFNAIPVLIADSVSGQTHAFWNFVIEPLSYLVIAPLTLQILHWTLFNPGWLENKIIEKGS